MIRTIELLTSTISIVSILVWLALLVALWFLWTSYFKSLDEREKKTGEKAILKLNIANILAAISLGVTGVSILLPTTGAILLYYLGQITQAKLQSAYPLVLAIVFFALSLLLGLWNAFSVATQYPNGEKLEWDKRYKWHALFFAAQFVSLFVGVMLLLFFFLVAPLAVEDLLKKSAQGSVELWHF